MFLIEIGNAVLVFNFMPESGALLLCGVSLIGGAFVARRLFKQPDYDKNFRDNDENENDEGGETR